MKFIGNYVILFLLFGAFLYLILPRLRKGLTKEQRVQKALWAGALFAGAKFVLDMFFP